MSLEGVRRQITTHGLILLALGLIVLGTAWYWDYSQDDVYITYRYSRNIAEGHGFVFNLGERVQGTTTPLFALLMAGVYRLTQDLVHAGNLVSALSLAGVAGVTYRLGRDIGGPWLGVGAALMLVLNPWFYISFGMETLTYTLLLVAAFWFARRDRDVACGVCAGLLAITRADGVLLAGVLGLAAVITRRRVPWAGSLTAAAIAGAWYLFAWGYFGSPLPQTFNAKASLLSGWTFLQDGLSWFKELYWNGSPAYAVAPVLWLVGVLTSAWRRSYLILVWVWSVVYVAGYTALNVSAFWYYAPLLPAIVLTMGYGAGAVWAWSKTWVRSRWVRQAAAVLLTSALLAGQARATFAFAEAPKRVETYRLVGKWLKANTPADSLVLVGDLGVVSWYSDRPTIDVPGLVVPEMHSHTETYAVLKYRPDYIVATQYWSWAAILNEAWLERDYRPVAQISTPGDQGFSPMIVFERRYPLPEASPSFQWEAWTVRAGLPSDSVGWGDSFPIVLWSQAPSGSHVGFEWPVCVLDGEANVIGSEAAPFFGGEYPGDEALGAETVKDVVWVTLPAGSESTRAEVWLGRNCTRPDQSLGEIAVEARPPQLVGEWQIGQALKITGLTVARGSHWAGGEVSIKLVWDVVSEVNADRSVFVHLLDEDGRLVAQSDAWPGGRPTSSLQAGERVTDEHRLKLPPDLPAGEYRLTIGVYDPVTGTRELLSSGEDGLAVSPGLRVEWPGGSGLP